MSPRLHHEITRVPVTALASCGTLLIAAEGPFLRFYHAKSSRYIASKRVFKTQTVHGVSVYAEELDDVVKIVVWGGRLVRAVRINTLADADGREPLSLCLSNVVKAGDWILDLAPRMSSLEDVHVYNQNMCAAVTAHNALLQLHIQHQDRSMSASSSLCLDITELTAASRSILYSAHLLWESSNCILIAAGTAFGEIMYWSWSKSAQGDAITQIHQVFLGHEGSIFDVHISKELQRGCCGNLKRVIASCSDDRTIRLWDVSNMDVNATDEHVVSQDADAQRTRHTGFSVAATDTQPDNSSCLAVGWGHTSRVWKVRFLDSSPFDGALALLSAGEDATSRTWKLVASPGKENNLPYTLQQTDCAAYHNGRNMWSVTTYWQAVGQVRIACGAADSKLTTHPLLGLHTTPQDKSITVADYTVQDLLHMAHPSTIADEEKPQQSIKVSKNVDSIRSYCFVLNRMFLLVMNSGKVFVESLGSDASSNSESNLATSAFVDQLEELSGYSTCTSVPAHGVAFIAGTKGNIYLYSAHDSTMKGIHKVTGKVGSLFATNTSSAEGRQQIVLLITLVGQKEAQLLFIDISIGFSRSDLSVAYVPVSDILTGPTITSMSVVQEDSKSHILLLGFRRGSIGLYAVSHNITNAEATLFRTIEKVHGDETVTAMKFKELRGSALSGHLYSVGRDGRLAVHMLDLARNTVKLVHNLTLPIGPNIEDLYFQDDRLLVHGFSSKKWVLYDITSEEEIMGVETGGAHRSWAFQPSSSTNHPQGGILVWTRTSSLHVCSQKGSNHGVIRSGGHGREIKAVAVSPSKECFDCCIRHGDLIATGAEDTDIKIFQYTDGELVCRRTLRKHTTGIQHLQWSDDGRYLFSSAGSEEFFVWRVRAIGSVIDIGIVCEYVYTPESEFSDLRIMSFDVTRSGSAYTIAMVFSDSSIKTYRYDPTVAIRWRPLAKGIYFTSCLTQCTFLSPTGLLTAGTDGHVVFWPLNGDYAGILTGALMWQNPTRIHQNASKTMASHLYVDGTTLIVSGGDDGALAFLLAYPTTPDSSSGPCASPPVLVNRAHGSAVTACATVNIQSRAYVLTSGNDEWVRLWEVIISNPEDGSSSKNEFDKLTIKRLSKVKTSVADVSSMAVLNNDDNDAARILVCGVGMEVIRLDLIIDEDTAAP